MNKNSLYNLYLKRLFDLIISVFALIILFPVYVIVALLVKINLKGNVFFTQERIGLDETPFKIIKFRSMSNETSPTGELLPDEQRLGKFGSFLRSTSLDELPGIFNILKGEMSFVGPRPLLPEYLPLYSNEQRKRHLIRPGLTGLAQVNGRNAIKWTTKFEYDLEYINHVSLLLDIKIILKTFLTVFKREGINAENSVTIERFTGDN